MKTYATTLFILSFLCTAYASADMLDDENVTAESNSALAQKAQKVAEEVRATVDQKKQSTIDDTKKSESEIQSLTAEKNKINGEVEKLKADTVIASKALQDNNAKLEKAKLEVQALRQLHDETNKKLLEIAAETDKTALELKELEQAKNQGAIGFNQVKEDAKNQGDKLAKMKAELSQKKAQAAILASANHETAIPTATSAPLVKAPLAESSVIPALNATSASPPLAVPVTNSTPASSEVNRVINSVAAEPLPTASAGNPGDLIFKKECKIYDRTTKDPQVIGLKHQGTSILKTEESKYWIGFSVSGQQKGYVAKTCF